MYFFSFRTFANARLTRRAQIEFDCFRLAPSGVCPASEITNCRQIRFFLGGGEGTEDIGPLRPVGTPSSMNRDRVVTQRRAR